MDDKIEINELLKAELDNNIYDVIKDAILKTAEKHNYRKYDIAKLIMAIYNNDFDYLTTKEDYRQQVKLLDDYFFKTYNHRLITFEMLKAIKSMQNSNDYKNITNEVANIDSFIRNNKKVPAEDLDILAKPLEDEKYDELMNKIENENSLKYSIAVVYDKLKRKELFNE